MSARSSTLKSQQSLRTALRRRRRALTAACQCCHARAVASVVVERIARDAVVAVYFARDGEIDLTPLIQDCRRRAIDLALPVVAHRHMYFAAYRLDEPLRESRYGIPEPVAPEPVAPTMVLAPLVAFDNHGRRLGMGGGYYDRYFASAPSVPRIGIAHECQRIDDLPANAWDESLAVVVTETGWHTFQTDE